MRNPTHPQQYTDKVILLRIPSRLQESLHHIQSIEQSTAGPDLAIMCPPLLDPVDLRVGLTKVSEHRTGTRGRLTREQAGLQTCQEAAADEEEGGAVLVGLLDELDLALGRGVGHLVCSHEGDVQRWTSLVRMLDLFSLMDFVLGLFGTYSGLHGGSGRQSAVTSSLGDPVHLDVHCLLVHLIGDEIFRKVLDTFLRQ